MLDAARVEQVPAKDDAAVVDVDVAAVLRHCAESACQRHRVPAETVALDLRPAIVRGREIDVDMIFRNLIDNAIKYGGGPDRPAQVEVEMWPDGRGRVITRIADNGAGIPLQLRRKIFGRFVRLGSELEREKTGTGLGLFIVRTLVRRLKGKIYVQGRGGKPGTVFEVDLPGEIADSTQVAAPDAASAPVDQGEGNSPAEAVR
jgi:signal transduction histidine kinase